MFLVLLKFSENKAKAGDYMEAHNQWLKRGFDEGVFLLAGSLQSGLGGSVMAFNLTLAELQLRVSEDPFVGQKIVSAEIIEILPKKVDQRLAFLLD